MATESVMTSAIISNQQQYVQPHSSNSIMVNGKQVTIVLALFGLVGMIQKNTILKNIGSSDLLLPSLQQRNGTANTSTTSSIVYSPEIQRRSVIYPKWDDQDGMGVHSWCQAPTNSSNRGFYLAKTFKTGSSSAAGIHLRISRQVGNRKFLNKDDCKHESEHEFSIERVFQSSNTTNRDNGFIWTIVRNPEPRALSAYYFYHAGILKANDTEQSLIAYLNQSRNQQTLQLQYDPTLLKPKRNGILYPSKPLNESIEDTYFRYENSSLKIRSNILEHYNFVAVTERWEESLVVLKFLLDLNHEDIILLSDSKAAGSWSWDWYVKSGDGCFEIPRKPKKFSPAVQSYLDNGFVHRNADTLLHEAALVSLDRTIEAIGRDRFDSELKKHLALKAFVADKCSGSITFPCSNTGKWQPGATEDCYLRDNGCGYPCVDRVLANHTTR